MDPLSITTSIITLYNAAAQLNEIRRHHSDADGTLAEIQHDCYRVLEILRHFRPLLRQRRELLQPDERFNSVTLEKSLEEDCNHLIQEVNKLLKDLAKLSSPPETRGELLWSHVKRHVNLRRLQHAHATIKETFQKFREHYDIMASIRRQNLPAFPSPASETSGNASTSTLSPISRRSTPPALDPEVRELRAKLFLGAIRSNEYEKVKRILEDTDVDPNDTLPLGGGSWPLLVATSAGNIEIVELLLRYDADISSQNSEGLTALHIATKNDGADMIDLLLRKKANPRIPDNDGHTPLWHAAYGQNTGNAFGELVINHGHGAINEPSDDTRRDDKLPTPLWAAAASGNLNGATTLLAENANVSIRDKNERTLLHRTEWPLAGPLTELLLDRGADPWARDLEDKKLPLHRAAEHGRMDIAAKLLDKMIEIKRCSKAEAANDRDVDGTTPLMCAALNGSLPLVHYLVRVWDATVGLRNNLGNDAFYNACAKGHISVAIYLLGLGADINEGNEENDTPLHVAARQGHEETVKFLLHLGANKEAMSKKWIQNARILQGTLGSRGQQQSATPAEAAEIAGRVHIANLIRGCKEHDRPVDWTVKTSDRTRTGS
ncbi:ankyrin repeat-containing domain protein [Thelonectria olida]|uniref:Ankyrin repeat-containing domain protein n=1 Tax=Thelonectria olida TaxID=1576542 RepID=A0A9P8VWQ4_9HYPO|nr:ankyrin repeat-containing domain protein [Thelonectria olida]